MRAVSAVTGFAAGFEEVPDFSSSPEVAFAAAGLTMLAAAWAELPSDEPCNMQAILASQTLNTLKGYDMHETIAQQWAVSLAKLLCTEPNRRCSGNNVIQ